MRIPFQNKLLVLLENESGIYVGTHVYQQCSVLKYYYKYIELFDCSLN